MKSIGTQEMYNSFCSVSFVICAVAGPSAASAFGHEAYAVHARTGRSCVPGGRGVAELRTAEDEHSEEEAPKTIGAQDAEEDGAGEDDGSEAGGIEGVEVDRDDAEEKIQYPIVRNELDSFRSRVRLRFSCSPRAERTLGP